jgi:hypothetical protein
MHRARSTCSIASRSASRSVACRKCHS